MRTFLLVTLVLVAMPASANSIEEAFCRAASVPVDRMEASEKFCRSFSRALHQLPAATAQEASVMFSPENLALMTTMMAAWIGSQGVPIVGQVVDAALLSLGVILLAAQDPWRSSRPALGGS